MIDSILNLVFPVSCILCGSQVLERRYGAACADCWRTLIPIAPPICTQCGTPAVAIEGPCGRCRTGQSLFDMARSAVYFSESAREIVHHLKYSDRISLAQPIGRLLRDVMEREHFNGELIVPVPLHRTRLRERGFNQAELIATELGLPLETRPLQRGKKTATQTGLSRSERMKNLSGAFRLRGAARGLSMILVDDVFTTGATMNEIARILKRGGAARVEVLTFARVPDGISPR